MIAMMNVLGFLPVFFCLPVFGLVGLAVTIFWIWMIVEVATKEPSEDSNKFVWLIVVILAGWLGALIYLLVRRPERIRKYGR